MRGTIKEEGITLIAFVLTIVVLIILTSISAYTGISTIQSSKFAKFKQQLEIMQAEVDLLYEDCKNDDGSLDINKINSIGKDLTSVDEDKITEAFTRVGVSNTEDYRYYDKETIESLDISGVDDEYFVSIADRMVISVEGIEYKGKMYYNLYQFPDKEKLENNIDRGEVNFSAEIEESADGWIINVSNIQYSKYVGKGRILYKEATDEEWSIAGIDIQEKIYSFEVLKPGSYTVKIVDAAGVSKEQQLEEVRGNVTYCIDTDNVKTQTFVWGDSIIDGLEFTPFKYGYTFMGWREDKEANGNVLTSRSIDRKNITLYAVFGNEITLSYNANGGSSTPTQQTDYQYYNNSNIKYPTFKLAGTITRKGYTFKEWRLNGTSGQAYSAEDNVTISSNSTMYAIWNSTTTTAHISGNADLLASHGRIVALSGPHQSYNNITSQTISGDGLSWYGSGAELYANCDTTITITGKVGGGALDGHVPGGIMLYINDALNKEFLFRYYENNDSSEVDVNTTIDLPAGSRCSIRVLNEEEDVPSMRFGYSIDLTFTAVSK